MEDSRAGKNLYQRRNAAKKEVYEHTFKKVKTDGLKYAYLPIETIKPIVERAYNNEGIIIDVGGLDIEEVAPPTVKQSQYDGGSSTWYHMRGTLTVTLVNMDDPADKITLSVVGEAKDNSDKVINKVYTAALKNFYKIEFNISDGQKDDTDAIQSDEALEKATPPGKTTTKKMQTDDPFFNGAKKKKETVAPKDDISDDVLNTGLLKASRDPRFSQLVKDTMIMMGAQSVVLLPREMRLELMQKIEEGSA